MLTKQTLPFLELRFFPKEFHLRAGTSFSKAPETFRARKSIAKLISNVRPYDYSFVQILLIWTQVLFIQEVSGVHTIPFLDTNELKMAIRARRVSEAFEKRTPELYQRTKRCLPSHLKFPMFHSTWLELIARHVATLLPNATYPSLQSRVQVEPKVV